MIEDTWAILATGPSMSQEVADMVRGHFHVVAVSNAHELAPWADVLVSNDRKWWVNNPKAYDFEGEQFCGLAIEAPKGVKKFPGAMSGSNSGLLAMQVAVSKGAKRILLFGIDLAGTHYFGDHGGTLKNPTPDRFAVFQKQFAGYHPKGVEVFNCSPSSALKAYPFKDAAEFIPAKPEPPPAGPQGDKGERGEQGEKGIGERGPIGPEGPPGPMGPMPDHQWQGTSLRFEDPEGGWGKFVDLRGPAGAQGYPGASGSTSTIGGGSFNTYFPSGW